MINNKLWQEVLDFDLDHPMSEYGFSTRLAAEQYWTKEFTASAILEYKKFMYLAAVSDQMVSPSEIVDVVWHQHLIFTTSYHEFCNLLGKQIQHIPSTHNREEVDKFKAAHERTHKIYRESFGDPPVEIWEYFGMFDTLGLTKSTHKLRSVVDMGIMFFFLSIPIFYFLLRGLYVKINNPYFLNGYVPFALIVIGGLHLFNKNKLLGIIRSFHPRSFIFRLRPAELIFLKTHDMERVVHGIMGEFAKNDEIRTTSDNYIEWAGKRAPRSLEEFVIVDELQRTGKMSFARIVKDAVSKPVFQNVVSCMTRLEKRFISSIEFGRLFRWNFMVLSIVTLFGIVRIITGIQGGKPVAEIVIVMLLIIPAYTWYLYRLPQFLTRSVLPKLYEREMVTSEMLVDDWQWQYLVSGSVVLPAMLLPLINSPSTAEGVIPRRELCTSSGGSGGSGGSCGSSGGDGGGCGGGCGGCGGD